jgi:two-component system NarL family sensor kinase
MAAAHSGAAGSQTGWSTVRYLWTARFNGRGGLQTGLRQGQPITSWGWMLGTGLYLDDIGQTLQAWRTERRPTFGMQQHVYLIAAAAMVPDCTGGIGCQCQRSRLSAKLKHLAQRVVNSGRRTRQGGARATDIIQTGFLLFSLKLHSCSTTRLVAHSRQTGPCRGVTVAWRHTPQAWAGPAQRALTEVRRISRLAPGAGRRTCAQRFSAG